MGFLEASALPTLNLTGTTDFLVRRSAERRPASPYRWNSVSITEVLATDWKSVVQIVTVQLLIFFLDLEFGKTRAAATPYFPHRDGVRFAIRRLGRAELAAPMGN
jgi:hypothetical protein